MRGDDADDVIFSINDDDDGDDVKLMKIDVILSNEASSSSIVVLSSISIKYAVQMYIKLSKPVIYFGYLCTPRALVYFFCSNYNIAGAVFLILALPSPTPHFPVSVRVLNPLNCFKQSSLSAPPVLFVIGLIK